jgi:hypothetical protein
MHPASCPFLQPNGSCLLPVHFAERCDASTVSSSTAFYTDVHPESGVFKVHLPTQAMVLYVPPIVVLLDTYQQSTHGHVVASWWWSAEHTLFIQVYLRCSPSVHTRPITTWTIVDFPITCIDHGGRYQIHTLRGRLEKTKRKTD